MHAGSRRRRGRRRMPRLRPPAPGEGPALSELCLRSKAVHGYDAVFIEACRDELSVEAANPDVIVAEQDGRAVGVAEISLADGVAELKKLFVEPDRHGRGLGRGLLDWAKERAIAQGARCIRLDADPGAVPFYEKMGAVKIGESPSDSVPGRFLPRFELRLKPAERS